MHNTISQLASPPHVHLTSFLGVHPCSVPLPHTTSSPFTPALPSAPNPGHLQSRRGPEMPRDGPYRRRWLPRAPLAADVMALGVGRQ